MITVLFMMRQICVFYYHLDVCDDLLNSVKTVFIKTLSEAIIHFQKTAKLIREMVT